MTLPRPFIKICSLREPGQAEFAVAARADAIGLIFAEARRKVTVERAIEIANELRRLDEGGEMLLVGVFVDQSGEEVNRIAERVGLDIVQLHGSETRELVASVERPVIKVVPLRRAAHDASIAGYETMKPAPIAYLVDAASASAAGGTGVLADWPAAARLSEARRVILAGGLTPENVGGAIHDVRPLGVDVSSGVETDGVKDRAKVIAFAMAARMAFAGLEVGQRRVVPVAETTEPVYRP